MTDNNNNNNKPPTTSKKRNFNKRHRSYSTKLDNEFFELASQGKSLTEIAYILEIPKKVLLTWSEDNRKGSFGKAFQAGKEACQAYHERLLSDMVTGVMEKVSAKQIDAQQFRLKTLFAEDWAPIEKKEVNVIDESKKMTDQELNERLGALLNTPESKQYIKNLVQKDFKPDLKVVED